MIRYTDPLRRRLRALRKLSGAAMRAKMWTDGVVVPTYWWDGHPNFGDDLTPWLLPEYGVVPVHREPHDARLAAVGSVLEFIPADFDGAVWGSGLMYDAPHPLASARVLAVRGALTHERLGATGAPALGDPGLLVSRRLRRPRPRWSIGFVPHGHHRSHRGFLGLADPKAGHRIVDVHQSARAAVGEIAACEVVVTTSLHGLVTADAFGIPALWTVLEPALNGGDFKFRDYESAVSPGRSRFVEFDESIPLHDLVARAQAADPEIVADVCRGLERSLAGLPEALGGSVRFPQGVWRAVRT